MSSSKPLSFEANVNTGRQKRLTGLDGNGPSTIAAFKASFPQPVDVGSGGNGEEEGEEHETDDAGSGFVVSETDEDDTETIRPTSPGGSQGQDQDETVETPSAIDIPRSGSNTTHRSPPRPSMRGAASTLHSYTTAKVIMSPTPPRSSLSTQRPLPPYRGGSNIGSNKTSGRITTDSASTASFETASEGSGILVDEAFSSSHADRHNPDSDEASSSSEEEGGVETPRPRDSNNMDPFSTPHTRDSTNTDPFFASTVGTDSLTSQSRLIRPNASILDNPQPGRIEADVSGNAIVQDQVRAESGELDSPVQRSRPTGNVRFAETQVQPLRTELQIRAKFARHAPNRFSRRFTRGRLKDGEIVKMEKMLVRLDVTSGSEQPSDEYDEKDSQRVDTRTIEKWREFMVVCRESHEDDAVLCLQMYKTRVSHIFLDLVCIAETDSIKRSFQHRTSPRRKNTSSMRFRSLQRTSRSICFPP